MANRIADPGFEAVRAAWLPYAGVTIGIGAAVGLGATLGLSAASAAGVRAAALVATVAQLAAYALLVLGRGHSNRFLAGWLGGMVLRFGALGLMAVWVTRSAAAPAATLVSLVGLLFVMLLLEPVFLRRGLETR